VVRNGRGLRPDELPAAVVPPPQVGRPPFMLDRQRPCSVTSTPASSASARAGPPARSSGSAAKTALAVGRDSDAATRTASRAGKRVDAFGRQLLHALRHRKGTMFARTSRTASPGTRDLDREERITARGLRRGRGPATPGGLRWHLADRRCRGGPRSTAPTVTAHLGQPRPDLIRRRGDRDGHRGRPLAVGDELGTGIGPGDLLIGCAPAHKPRTHPYCIDQSCRPGYTNDLASNCHATTVGGSARPPLGTNVTTCCLAALRGVASVRGSAPR
jgi:hypothetical protein